jgi:uncharacterized protein YkwD
LNVTRIRPLLPYVLSLCILLSSTTWGQQVLNKAEIAEAIIEATNALRIRNDLPKLDSNPPLQAAAFSHSQEMIQRNYFSHTSPVALRSKTSQRVKAEGLSPKIVGENIFGADGWPDNIIAQKCITSWLESAAHRANLLNPRFTHIGVGVAKSGDTFRITQVLAGDLDFKPAVTVANTPSTPSLKDQQSIADKLFTETNLRRTDAGLPPFEVDLFLQKAALGHSEEMARLKYFNHRSPNQDRYRVRDRVRLVGAEPRRLGENIYRCSGYAENTIAFRSILSFMESPDHRAQILDGNYTRLGIGVAEMDGSYYVTQVFAGD